MHVIGTAGHVDHGKSTLVKALTGIDPDRLEEERERGLTIDLGFAWWTLPSGREVGVIDVPGHERFIRNMLAGVGGIDAALFVVAADEGWKPQSAEHLTILDFLQVRAGVVAVTKSDLVDSDMLDLAVEDVREHLRDTCIHNAAIVGVSAVTGEGLDALQDALEAVLREMGEAPDRGRARLFVDRSFTITGAGTVVTGTLGGGSLAVGNEIEVLPSGQRARIRSLQTHRLPVESAAPGTRVAANLVGLDRTGVARGDALVHPGVWRTTDTFAARLRTARDLQHPLGERGAYELYVGSAEVPCRVKFLEEAGGQDAGAAKAPVLRPGEQMLVQVFCMRPLPLDPGDRFIIRDVGRWETVAGGVVLDHFPGRVRRGDPLVLERLRAREASARETLLVQLVGERKAIALNDLGWLTGLGPPEVAAALQHAVGTGAVVTLPGFVADAGYTSALAARVVEVLEGFHAAHPLEPGMPRETVRSAISAEARLFGELLDGWLRAGAVLADGATIRLPGRGSVLSPQDEAEAARLLDALRNAGASPPELEEIGVGHELVKALERRGEIVVVAPGLAYDAGALGRIEQAIVDLIARQGPATVAQVRDAIGTTRKYAVPLLEYLDGSGLTRRQGDARVLGPRGRKLAEA